MQPQKHTNLGIASFGISFAAFGLVYSFITIFGVLEAMVEVDADLAEIFAGIIGLGILFCIPANLVALGLGIAGLTQSDKKKIFAILGTVSASVSLLLATLAFLIS